MRALVNLTHRHSSVYHCFGLSFHLSHHIHLSIFNLIVIHIEIVLWQSKLSVSNGKKDCNCCDIVLWLVFGDLLAIMVEYDENGYAAELKEKPVCRFCLTQDDALTNIYSNKSNSNTQASLSMQIMACVSIEVR